MNLELLKPKERLRVMDLVDSVGIDVTDWANFKGGIEKAASNPKYCYEWSYEDREKNLIVLNLWYDGLLVKDDVIFQQLNLRDTAEKTANGTQKRRAFNMDFSLQRATRLDLDVRVIICDGRRKKEGGSASKAETRMLDAETWYVESYNTDSGECKLRRGQRPVAFIDQFSVADTPEEVGKRESTTSVYERCPKVRRIALNRANGKCEWCGELGFKTKSGSIYLETHHIQPLCEAGEDNEHNVIALCPNHHREAHFGEASLELKKQLKKKLQQLISQ
ncbi:HNH endonuclease [Vibrio vulnificus]|uniref:HNH endonuclease n=2 Tax=Vibrio vulnificus TaxID=672 RepID=UPI000928E813|nr:HNH endonuclease signature motif containing protein [Vibrio vulnificus]MDT9658834.1 HNH endonuclease [Vibrio vulnificus]OJI37527.1 HNH endonuclease [Vibrio vulnificus]